MKVIDVTLRESLYYESGMTYEDRLEYLRSLKKNVSNRFLQCVEIGYIDNDSADELNYDESYIINACNILGNDYEVVAMMHIDKSDVTKWNKEILSKLSIVRIMLNKDSLDGCEELIKYFHEIGVKVSLNRIYAANADMDKIAEMERKAYEMNADYFYCADSSGSFSPGYVNELCKMLMQNRGDMQIGLHTHDHMQMALSNTLISVNYGIEMADVSITGAGKGGGNLKMEFALPLLYPDEANSELFIGLLKLMTDFNGLVTKDNKSDVVSLLDFLTGYYKFNLKDVAYLEKESSGDAIRYIKEAELLYKNKKKGSVKQPV